MQVLLLFDSFSILQLRWHKLFVARIKKKRKHAFFAHYRCEAKRDFFAKEEDL